MRTLTTIRDAEQLVSDWTERYLVQPTDAQVQRAAAALVTFLGGFGADADETDDAGRCLTEDFDLDTALGT